MERIATDEEWGGYGPWCAIDRYEPCFELASGGMGTVFLARVTSRAALHRFVALKRIHPHLVGEPGFLEMFLDEAHVASRLVHPHVCSVFDFDAAGGRPYIAMEYLMGETLTQVAKALSRLEDPAEVERACRLSARVIADACEGLHAAHELRDPQGSLLEVVHRDVSPQNLFLTYDGAVKVVDFGLVRMAQCLHKTKTGIVKGKFAYLAPEAVAMKQLDRRADVWGLGVVLWELLTGQRLFQRATEVDTVVAVAHAQIPPPSTVRAGVPPEIDDIVMCALARERDERYATARAFGRDLVAFLHGGPEPIGLSDLAEWTDRLFPGGRERKLELLEVAEQMRTERSERSDRPPSVSMRVALPPPAPVTPEPDSETRIRSPDRRVCSAPPGAPVSGSSCTVQVESVRPSSGSVRPAPRSCAPAGSRSDVLSEPPPMPTPARPRLSRPARRMRWATRGAAMPALVLALALAAGGGYAAATHRDVAAYPPPGGSPAASPDVSRPLARGVALAEAPQRAGLYAPAGSDASSAICSAAPDTMVLELVSEGDTPPRRILVRPVAQPERRP